MKLLIREKNKYRINKLIEWLLYMAGYTLVFIFVTSFFKSVRIDSEHLILWSIIIVLITYILNKTIKPVLVWLTLPLTAITLGLFYLIINVLVLKITDFILMSHFDINGIIMPCIVSIVISIMNTIMDSLIKNNIIKERNK